MECTLYNTQRLKFLSNIGNMLNYIDGMSMYDIFLLVMSASDFDILKVVISYIQSCFDTRSGTI